VGLNGTKKGLMMGILDIIALKNSFDSPEIWAQRHCVSQGGKSAIRQAYTPHAAKHHRYWEMDITYCLFCNTNTHKHTYQWSHTQTLTV